MRRICVVGAGTMGSGIAQACSQSNFEVSMVDVKQEFIDRGFENIRKTLEGGIKRGKLTREEAEGIKSNIKGTVDLREGAGDADLVIEAVFEDMEVKKKLFKDLNTICPTETIFATNTSSLSVTEMAEASGRGKRFSGLHFFYPAPINQLIEVIPTPRTSEETLRTLMSFSRAINKVPIKAKDAPGFAVNRFFVPFLNEACRMLEEGLANVPTIEAAAKKALSVRMGPFALMNATGIPIAYHSQNSLYRALGEFYKPAEILRKQFESGQLWNLEGEVEESSIEALESRFLGQIFTIACQLVEEGVATREDVDKGATIGLRWKRGPFSMMNSLGMEKSLRIVERYSSTSGIEVPKTLIERVKSGQEWELKMVRFVKEGRLGIITIDRPQALNALNTKVLRDLENAIDHADIDQGVQVIILTGEGRAFVAGADIAEMMEKSPIEGREFTRLGQSVFGKIENLGKVVIAAVNGFALGGGCELTLACDITIASEEAQIGLPEVTLGIHPGFGGTQRLPRLVGRTKAKELIFTGDMIDAQEAERIGLVNKVVPRGKLLEEAKKIGERIASNGPLAVKLAKSAINRGLDVSLEAGLAYESETVSLTFSTEDKKEGMRAFLEKRKPLFKGR